MARIAYLNKVVENSPEKHPERAGFVWDDDEIMTLLLEVRKNETFENIAINHKRTERSIFCQLRKIAIDYHNEGMEMEKIIKYTRLTEDVIRKEINNIEKKNNSKIKKEITTANIPIVESEDETLKTLKNIEILLKQILEKL